MVKKPAPKLVLIPFEDASILRKFTVLFLITSIVPMVLLYYFYTRHGHLGIPRINFTYALVLMVLGVFIGFISIRSLLIKVIRISQQNSKALESFMSPQAMQELTDVEDEIAVLSRSFSAVTHRLEENTRSLEAAKKTLHTVMSKVGQGISNMENIDTFLAMILETLTNALGAKTSTLLLLNEAKTELTIHTVYGVKVDGHRKLSLKLSDGSPLAKVLSEKKPKTISAIFLQNNDPALYALFGENLLCAPLLRADRVIGLITLSRMEEQGEEFSNEDLDLVFNLACQTAVAIENSKLNRDIEKTYFETLSALALAVDAKDKYAYGHIDRVLTLVTMIGKRLGLDEEDLSTLKKAARVYDLGKIGIPDEILKKNGRLTDEEWVIMRRHPEIGESIIKPVHSLQHLCDLVRHHHEKLDGTGYPDGLKREEISPLVRILSVADVYDSLTTERPWRPRQSPPQAISTMRTMKNELDQDIVEIMVDVLDSPPKIDLKIS